MVQADMEEFRAEAGRRYRRAREGLLGQSSKIARLGRLEQADPQAESLSLRIG
jgi:hypothetical protein